MDFDSISATQIITVSIFLLALIVLQIVIKKNKNRFSSSWRSSKRIKLIEEKSLSPTEKLRIISVDSTQYLIISNKGKKSTIIPLGHLQQKHSPKSNGNLVKVGNQERMSSLNHSSNATNTITAKNPSAKNQEGHQLSKAIKTAREMNPAVSYKI